MLTDKTLKAWKPGVPRKGRHKPQTRLSDKGGAVGLLAEIGPGGTIGFFFKWYTSGKVQTMRLGSYPAMSLAAARVAAMAARESVKAGDDPKVSAAADKARKASRGSVDALLDFYIERLGKRRSATEARRVFDKDVLPVLGGMPAADVTSEHIKQVLLRFTAGDRNAKVGANRCRSSLSAAWNQGLTASMDLDAGADVPDFGLKFNVVAPIKKRKSVEQVGNRSLSWWETGTIWHAIDDSDVCAEYGQALRFLLATGQRVEEVLGMRRSEIEETGAGSLWVIPAVRRKNGIEHAVPLTAWQLSLLPSDGNLVFERGGKAPKPMALRQAVDRLTASVEVEKFTPRDSRRTWKTLAGDAGLSLEIRNRIQGHAFTDIGSQHYDRHDYAMEKRTNMGCWCNRLQQELDIRSNSRELVQ